MPPLARRFRRVRPGYLVAREELLAPRGPLARLWRLLIGRPLATTHEVHERLSNPQALAILAADALSSVAYGPEEIMKVLILAGPEALRLTPLIAVSITLLLAILVLSYRQTIQAYPSGGGSYTVASDNLGTLAGLVAAAALLIDYTLTVAVSVAAGIAGLTSALPAAYPYRLPLMVLAVLLIMLGNLRGVRQSGMLFTAPTYAFLVGVLAVIAWGGIQLATTGLPAYAPGSPPPEPTRPFTLFLLLSAFAQGCSALTGVEAISNGVRVFRPPEAQNAQRTLVAMGVLLGTMVLGISFLGSAIGVVPDPTEQETVLSRIARTLVGPTWLYYGLQLATLSILVLAANTSFADFPRLASILARDGFMPHYFQRRGDRLVFSTGIVVLAGVAIGLLVLFEGSIDRLIPLYALGVFTAFTLSQAGMVQHWRKHRGRRWQLRAAINGLGAATTLVVVVVIASTKLAHGAWTVVVLIPALVLGMLGIRRHYTTLARALAAAPGEQVLPVDLPPAVVVPVGRLDRPTLAALNFARSISPEVTAVHVADSREEAAAFRAQWHAFGLDIPLVIIESPYRRLVEPLLAYIDAVDRQDPRRPITVVLPEFVPRHWWEYLLHNLTAWRLKLRLFFRPDTIVVDVPYHVGIGFEGASGAPRPGGASAARREGRGG
jgi:amino acid transporter